MAMVPHERSLVARLESKPFALIGVNGDDRDPKLKEKNVEKKISWRSFKNVRKDQLPIAEEWNLEGWPTLYLIDHKGIIRKKWVGSPGDKVIDQSIDDLLKEAAQESK